MAIITNFNQLRSLHEAARRGGANSRAWIEFAVTMFDSFPALYDVAKAMNEERDKQRKAEGWTRAVTSVLAERQRQIKAEGYTPDHDDEHANGELAAASACYARHVKSRSWVFLQDRFDAYRNEPVPDAWPFDAASWKPRSPREDMVKATALGFAEIERMDRTIWRP